MLTYLRNVIIGLDVFENVVLLGGAQGETISLHAARAQSSGRRWGCLLCRWLDWSVARGHCADTLAGKATSLWASIHAAVQLVGLAILIWSVS